MLLSLEHVPAACHSGHPFTYELSMIAIQLYNIRYLHNDTVMINTRYGTVLYTLTW